MQIKATNVGKVALFVAVLGGSIGTRTHKFSASNFKLLETANAKLRSPDSVFQKYKGYLLWLT